MHIHYNYTYIHNIIAMEVDWKCGDFDIYSSLPFGLSVYFTLSKLSFIAIVTGQTFFNAHTYTHTYTHTHTHTHTHTYAHIGSGLQQIWNLVIPPGSVFRKKGLVAIGLQNSLMIWINRKPSGLGPITGL